MDIFIVMWDKMRGRNADGVQSCWIQMTGWITAERKEKSGVTSVKLTLHRLYSG